MASNADACHWVMACPKLVRDDRPKELNSSRIDFLQEILYYWRRQGRADIDTHKWDAESDSNSAHVLIERLRFCQCLVLERSRQARAPSHVLAWASQCDTKLQCSRTSRTGRRAGHDKHCTAVGWVSTHKTRKILLAAGEEPKSLGPSRSSRSTILKFIHAESFNALCRW